jgi:hypothetical protein
LASVHLKAFLLNHYLMFMEIANLATALINLSTQHHETNPPYLHPLNPIIRSKP